VYSSDAGKGKTLAAFADKLGVDISDVIAVGDSNNDATLIEKAGLGLAVANACDALKEIADQTICDNSEHIAKYVLEHFII
jgi:hydroxymethylpyrimidine pyrophosphatase-like HAD family hydrolase